MSSRDMAHRKNSVSNGYINSWHLTILFLQFEYQNLFKFYVKNFKIIKVQKGIVESVSDNKKHLHFFNIMSLQCGGDKLWLFTLLTLTLKSWIIIAATSVWPIRIASISGVLPQESSASTGCWQLSRSQWTTSLQPWSAIEK